MMLDVKQMKRIVEAALLTADKPLSVNFLKQLLGEENCLRNNQVRDVVGELSDDYKGRGIELKEVAQGYRFQACEDLSLWLAKLWEEKPMKYSRAFLEILALIAYKQPITRAEIEDVRGVSVSTNIIRTLMEREWIKIAGHKDVPGRPALYVTTNKFLDYFNLKSLKELPIL